MNTPLGKRIARSLARVLGIANSQADPGTQEDPTAFKENGRVLRRFRLAPVIASGFIVTLIAAASLQAGAGGGETGTVGTVPIDEPPVGEGPFPVLVSHEEATLMQAEYMAPRWGVSVDEAMRRIGYQKAFDQLAPFKDANPDTFSGAWQMNGETWQGFMRFKGPAPDGLAQRIEELGIDVVVSEDGRYAAEELRALSTELLETLRNMGSRDVVTAPSEKDEAVYGWAVAPPGLEGKSDQELSAMLPAKFQGPNFLIEWPSSMPGGTDDFVYGGDALRNQGQTFPWCTTGFTVQKNGSATTKGFATAGHCHPAIDSYVHDNTVSHSIEFKDKHLGVYGDYSWYRVPGGVPKYDDFYFDDWMSMDVTRVMQKSEFDVGDNICLYGRNSGKHCDDIYMEWVGRYDADSGVTIYGLMAMVTRQAQSGDSGGPWYLNDGTAVGIHHGAKTMGGAARDLFSTAAQLEDILPVKIMTCCGP